MDPVTATVAGVAGALKATAELVAVFRKTKKPDHETERLLSEIESRLLDLKKEVFGLEKREIQLLEENSQLRTKIRTHEERTADRQRYKRKQVGKSIVLVDESEPGIFYCPTCYETPERRLVPIQVAPKAFAKEGITHHCVCGTTFDLREGTAA
jgi:hypothetical protein